MSDSSVVVGDAREEVICLLLLLVELAPCRPLNLWDNLLRLNRPEPNLISVTTGGLGMGAVIGCLQMFLITSTYKDLSYMGYTNNLRV